MRVALIYASRLIGFALALALAIALILLVLLPRLMGWVPLTVLSGSMEPSIPVGSQVVVERVQTEEELSQIRTGDVISFMPEPDDPTLVTHRVVSQAVSGNGGIVLTTRGDANDADDPEVIGLQQIRGVSRYHLPYAGYVASFLDVNQKRTGTVVIALALLAYAAWNVLSVFRDRRKAEPPSDRSLLAEVEVTAGGAPPDRGGADRDTADPSVPDQGR